MDAFKKLISIRDYCQTYPWPRRPQWNHWIYAQSPVAKKCVKKIGGRYLIDLLAFEEYITKAGLNEPADTMKFKSASK